MKILMVHPHDLYSPMEPWTIRIMKFAEILTARGHQVVLAYFPLTGSREHQSGKFRIVPLGRQISAGTLLHNTRALTVLARQADVVHFQKAHFYAALPALLAAYIAGKPAHYDWDDWEEKIFYSSLHRRSFNYAVTGFSFSLMEHLLPFLTDSASGASEALRSLTIRRGADPRRVVSAPVGADLDLFHPGNKGTAVRKKYALENKLLVFYHGQLHSCQYVSLLLQAIRVICIRNADRELAFMVLGDGSELEALKKCARDLGVGNKLIFPGHVSRAEVPDYVAAADICVAPFDDNEVTRCKSPLKLAEYMAAGKPVVASDVGEVKAMLGNAGIIVPPGDADHLASAILALAGDKERRIALAGAARQRAEQRYNWGWSVTQLEAAYAGGVQ